jgi:hypothetical protein
MWLKFVIKAQWFYDFGAQRGFLDGLLRWHGKLMSLSWRPSNLSCHVHRPVEHPLEFPGRLLTDFESVVLFCF